MEITSNMSNDVIDINILQNYIDGMKTKSNKAKILNIHFCRNLRKSGHQHEQYVKYVK